MMNIQGSNSSIAMRELKKAMKVHVERLSSLSPWHFFLGIGFDWAVIVGAVTISETFKSPILYALAILLVAGRQHALMFLCHEATHFRISSNRRWNDFISDVFAAYPTFFDTAIYRRTHMPHHRHLNTSLDPDWTRKLNHAQWTFPKTKYGVAGLLASVLFFRGLIDSAETILHFSGLKELRPFTRKSVLSLLPKVIFWCATIALLATSDSMALFAKYWLVPYFFVSPFFQRIRSIAEHFALPNNSDFTTSRDVTASRLERLFFAPHNVNFHLVHHIFSSIPFYNLREMYLLLMETETYRQWAYRNTSYVIPSRQPVLRDLIGYEKGSVL